MKIAAICLTLPFGLASASSLAQGASSTIENLRACSLLAHAERLECLEKLSRNLGPPSPANQAPPAFVPTRGADNWIVSETTSPVDYTPVAVATASSGAGPDGSYMQLSIQCRSGRTELVIGGPSVTRRGEDYAVFYGVNGGQPVGIATGTPASGTGVGIKGDVARLLTSLPDRGEVTFRVTARSGAALEGQFALASLKPVLDRLAVSCKWPTAAGAPHNR